MTTLKSVLGWVVTILLIVGFASCALYALTVGDRNGQVRAILYRR